MTEVTTPLVAIGTNPESSDFGWEGFMLRKLLFPLDPLKNSKLEEEQEERRGKIHIDTNLALVLSVDVSAQVLCCILCLGSPVTLTAARYLQVSAAWAGVLTPFSRDSSPVPGEIT